MSTRDTDRGKRILAAYVTPGTEILLAGTWRTITSTITGRASVILVTADGTRVPTDLFTELVTR